MAVPRQKFSSQASPELLAAMREIARREGASLPGRAGGRDEKLHRGQGSAGPARGDGPLPGQPGGEPPALQAPRPVTSLNVRYSLLRRRQAYVRV